MIEIYHLPPSRSIRVVWALEELGLEYLAREVAWPVRTRQPEYLKLNPAGTIPTLVDGDIVITESMVACDYVSRTYGDGGLTLDPSDPEYFSYQQWMWFGEATIVNQLSNVMRYGPNAPPGQHHPQLVDDALAAYTSRLPVLEQGLPEQDFAVAGRLTLADISLGYALLMGSFTGLAGQFGPRTSRYFEAISARPAFRRASAMPGA